MRTTPQDKQVVTVAYISGSKLSTCSSRFEDGWFIPLEQGLGGTRVIAWKNETGRWHTLNESPTTVEDIRAEIARLEGELSRLRGEPLVISDMCGTHHDIPAGGALLTYAPAISEYGFTHWYSELDKAKAALLAMARAEGVVPDDSGLNVDLSPPGAQFYSGAYITRR